jgi:pimeloyl-ACP methyl ester carboxylesterase
MQCLALEEIDLKEYYLQEPIFAGQVYVRETGLSNSEILLLVHGVGDDAGRDWDSLLPELSQKYHVIIPDLPGFGRSSKGNHLYSPENYASFLDWLIKRLPPKAMNLVGHSLGGGISLVYTAYHGQGLKRLVLIDSVGVMHYLAVSQNFVQKLALDRFLIPPVSNPLGKVASLILEKAARIPFAPEIILSTGFLRQRFLAADPARIAGLALIQTDYSLLLGQIDVPTWLIWGELDNIAPVRIADVLQWTLPRAQKVVLSGIGHVPMKEDSKGLQVALGQALQTFPETRQLLALSPNRKGSCEGKRGTVFEGAFDEISISSCDSVLLKNVTAKTVKIEDSEVVIEQSRLAGNQTEPAMSVMRSRVTMTGVDIVAEMGILSDQSRLDLAGVRFIDAVSAIRATGNPSAVLCSSSTKVYQGKVTALHLSRSLKAGESL